MRITLLPSAVGAGGEPSCQFVTSYLVNDTVAIDAGCLGLYAGPREQRRVRHVLLTHTHVDHVGSLPVFIENVYEGKRDCVTIYGSEPVLDCLRRDVFNDRIWPDFIKLSTPEAPFLRLVTIEAGRQFELDGLRFTPVPVNHVVPTLGFLMEDATAAVAIPSDTGPTDEIWEIANRTANLKAVFLEATFPNSMTWLADVSKHLTPAQFMAEMRKVRTPVTFFAVHIKAAFRAQVVAELEALCLPNLVVAAAGQVYEF